jgi:hypothetical protein
MRTDFEKNTDGSWAWRWGSTQYNGVEDKF